MYSQGFTEDSGNARANIPNASKERNLRDNFRHPRVLLKRIPGMQGFWKVASSNRLKIDLQDAYFHVLIENKVYKFRVLPFGLNTAPQVFTSLGNTVAAYMYLHRQDICNPISQ